MHRRIKNIDLFLLSIQKKTNQNKKFTSWKTFLLNQTKGNLVLKKQIIRVLHECKNEHKTERKPNANQTKLKVGLWT